MSFITTKPQEIGVKDLSPQEREEVLEFIYQCVMEKRIFVFSATPAGEKMFGEGVIATSHSLSVGRRAGSGGGKYAGGRGAGGAYCTLLANGVIAPYIFMPVVLGNIMEQPFSQMWRESSVLKEARDRALYRGHCGKCDCQLVCEGCRAYAYFKDYLASDGGCKFD
ncbi:MAG TPA: hypothetical protein PK844_01540 [Candidatus Atribacteria bacterium]|nr:hypothetical protein [Candidatus Atribacteria bacterium]